jgi:hypothetical protein
MVRKYYTFIRNKNITILGIIKNMPWYKKEAIKKDRRIKIYGNRKNLFDSESNILIGCLIC